jgi:WD40 repeat protein
MKGLAFAPSGPSLRAVFGRISPDTPAPAPPAEVHAWDLRTGRLVDVQTLKGFPGTASQLSFHPDGERLAMLPRFTNTAEAMFGGVWDISSGKKQFTLGGSSTAPRHGLAYSPDGRRVVTFGDSLRDEHRLTLYDAATGRELIHLSGHGGPVWACGFSADGQRLLAAGELANGRGVEIRVWDALPEPGGTRP